MSCGEGRSHEGRWGAVWPLSPVHTLYCEFSATTHLLHASVATTSTPSPPACTVYHLTPAVHPNNTPSRCLKEIGRMASPRCCVRAGSQAQRTPSCAATARGSSARVTICSSTNVHTRTTPSVTTMCSEFDQVCRCMECHEALICRCRN
ncbi:uncharacterized protein LOC121870654 isoform X1 [Homarus americanus]|uniref:uncharacterized protein LOC121870654 isoform X1 n=1 Tax=Homarus americanus TaxID=6706 RepID=UPI001C44262C|nr:uncharacterized protein LOC121870654 isoform X1 [Homarus americanus]